MLSSGLPCRSNSANLSTLSSTVSWSHLIPSMMAIQLHKRHKSLWTALWMTLSPSRTPAMTRASAIRSSTLTTCLISMENSRIRSTLSRLAQSKTATGQSAPVQQTLIDHEEVRRWRRAGDALLRAHVRQKGQALEDRKLNGILAIGDEGYGSTGVGMDHYLAEWLLYQREILLNTYVASKSFSTQPLKSSLKVHASSTVLLTATIAFSSHPRMRRGRKWKQSEDNCG